MGTERHRPPSKAYFATQDIFDVARQERPPSPADSSLSRSTRDPNDIAGIKRHDYIPTIAISEPGDDRSLDTSPFKCTNGDRIEGPRFNLYDQTISPSRHTRDGFSCSKLSALKKKTYHVLSLRQKGCDKGGFLKPPSTDRLSSGSPIWKRRATSMPLSGLQKRPHLHHAEPVAARPYLALESPPIVDFTKFEDRYRSTSSDYNLILSVSEGKKNNDERKARSLFSSNRSGKPDNVFANKSWKTAKQSINADNGCVNPKTVQTTGINETVRNSVLYPANERKLHPRLIMDAIENASEMVDIRGLLNVDDLLRTYDADQEDFELRAKEGERGRKSKQRKTRTVFGESIQNVFRYASAKLILGEREYILPIVVLHSVEEVYRTGIYQSNLFRTLPNRPRLHELISIFDCEEQPPGSIIRSHQSPSDLEGFGAATSLHLESTPDICALLTSYLSALPESIVAPNLFEAIWKLCEVDKQPHNGLPEPQPASILSSESSAPVRLSSIPLARSYTPRCEATCILIAQLLLHLLPSSHFFLFVYLLSFFSQVALVREENGVGIEDLSKMFGARIFGHGDDDMTTTASDLQPRSKSSKAKGKEKERNGRGEVMMVWFLRRWGPLFETLFEVVDDAKLGVLHRNKLMRKDSLGKAAITAYTAAYEAISSHDAVESEVSDELEGGERDDEVDDVVERELLQGGDICGNVGALEPVNVVGSPLTVHAPLTANSQKRPMSPPSVFARKGRNSLSPPERNVISSRKITSGPISEDSPQSSSASSGSSSSSLPPYTARPSRAIETDSNPTVKRCLVLRTERPNSVLGEVIPPCADFYHSTPKKSDVSERTLENKIHPRIFNPQVFPSQVAPQQQDEGSGIIGTNDRFIDDEDGSSIFHERLLDVSIPISIFDFDETLPVTTTVGNNPHSLFPTPTSGLSLTTKTNSVVGKELTHRITAGTSQPAKRPTSAFSNGQPDTLRLRLSSAPRRSSVSPNPKDEFLSSLPAPPLPYKSSERILARSQPKLPASRSSGFQNQPQSPGILAASVIKNPDPRREKENENDAVISALRERLIEIEKERDEARRIVAEVRLALRETDVGSSQTLLP